MKSDSSAESKGRQVLNPDGFLLAGLGKGRTSRRLERRERITGISLANFLKRSWQNSFMNLEKFERLLVRAKYGNP
jgi:hypothetical protein